MLFIVCGIGICFALCSNYNNSIQLSGCAVSEISHNRASIVGMDNIDVDAPILSNNMNDNLANNRVWSDEKILSENNISFENCSISPTIHIQNINYNNYYQHNFTKTDFSTTKSQSIRNKNNDYFCLDSSDLMDIQQFASMAFDRLVQGVWPKYLNSE